MTYRLFIDDLRDPVENNWIIARSSDEAIGILNTWGLPFEIAFDHDLGGDDTSMKVLNWIEEEALYGTPPLRFDRNFFYTVHSQNPVGAKNIRDYMNALLENFLV